MLQDIHGWLYADLGPGDVVILSISAHATVDSRAPKSSVLELFAGHPESAVYTQDIQEHVFGKVPDTVHLFAVFDNCHSEWFAQGMSSLNDVAGDIRKRMNIAAGTTSTNSPEIQRMFPKKRIVTITSALSDELTPVGPEYAAVISAIVDHFPPNAVLGIQFKVWEEVYMRGQAEASTFQIYTTDVGTFFAPLAYFFAL
jgi:hypothetical protein